MFRLSTACLLLYAFAVGSLAAQQTKEAQPRIRVTPFGPESKRIVGMPVSLGADTVRLVLAGATDTISIARVWIRRLEERSGRRSNLGRGAAIGAVVGGVLGGTAMVIYSTTGEDGGGQLEALATSLSIAGGAAIGALLGGGVGLLSSHERWRLIPTVAPSRGPVAFLVGARVRVSF